MLLAIFVGDYLLQCWNYVKNFLNFETFGLLEVKECAEIVVSVVLKKCVCDFCVLCDDYLIKTWFGDFNARWDHNI